MTPGYTKIGVYRNRELLFEQNVKILYGTPKITSAVSEKSGIRITWNKSVGNLNYYKVFIKNGSSWKSIARLKDTSYLWSGATFGTKYTFTVRGTDKNGNYITTFDSTGKTVTL